MRLRRRSRRKGSKVKAEVMGYLGIWESGRSMVLFFFSLQSSNLYHLHWSGVTARVFGLGFPLRESHDNIRRQIILGNRVDAH